MVGTRQTRAFHTDSDEHGRRMSVPEKERMMKPYLPQTPQKRTPEQSPSRRSHRFHHKQRIRPAIRLLIHSILFNIIHTFFSLYIRTRQAYHAIVNQVLAVLYYHHRTPELIKKDVNRLTKVPKHLSIILQLPPEGGEKDRLETLMNDACEIAAWSASAGVPLLSIYEKTGEPSHYDPTCVSPVAYVSRSTETIITAPPPTHITDNVILLRRSVSFEANNFTSRTASAILQSTQFT